MNPANGEQASTQITLSSGLSDAELDAILENDPTARVATAGATAVAPMDAAAATDVDLDMGDDELDAGGDELETPDFGEDDLETDDLDLAPPAQANPDRAPAQPAAVPTPDVLAASGLDAGDALDLEGDIDLDGGSELELDEIAADDLATTEPTLGDTTNAVSAPDLSGSPDDPVPMDGAAGAGDDNLFGEAGTDLGAEDEELS
jgi:hypothetical protein